MLTQEAEIVSAPTVRLKSPATLRALMDQQGVTVRSLASAAGLSGHSMIQQLRDGSRPGCTVRVAEGIATALGTTTGTLFAPAA